MGEVVGSISKSRLTETVLNRIRARGGVLYVQALLDVHTQMGSDAGISAGAHGQMCLLAYQAALMEEQVADIKTIKDKQEV